MSKTLNMLNTANKQRSGKYSSAENKEAQSIHHEPRKLEQNVSKTNLKLIIGSIFFILMILNLALTVRLFVTINKIASEKYNSVQKIDHLEEIITNNANGIQKISDDLQAVSVKTKSLNTKVEQIQETTDSQAAAIDNLIKAKNSLFNKVSALEAEINNLKDK